MGARFTELVVDCRDPNRVAEFWGAVLEYAIIDRGPNGEVEIGYGIAPGRRRRGHATRAVALVLDLAREDPAVRTVLADTVLDNVASQRALEKNGFRRAGTHADPSDGEPLIRWEIAVAAR